MRVGRAGMKGPLAQAGLAASCALLRADGDVPGVWPAQPGVPGQAEGQAEAEQC